MSDKALRTAEMLRADWLVGDRVVWLGSQGDDHRERDERALTEQLRAEDWCGTVVALDGPDVRVQWDDDPHDCQGSLVVSARLSFLRLLANDPYARARGWK